MQQEQPIAYDAVEHGSRAAQYVRMSTNHQKYSIQNQEDAITKYAAQRSLTIVRTYEDEGRSGLRIFGRYGLRELIDDVRFKRSNFDCVLVYDVSRWGRFQDVDESAYYEFICKRAGIKVHYCAEEFENDGSLVSTILKHMKRVNAADYSRQLSTRVFIGQCRITELGFWHGGQAGFGLRRHLIDEHGIPKQRLEYGQQKYLQTDRVVLKPGPAFEVKTVKRIFRAFVTQEKCVTEIAAELNADQIRTTRGNLWSAQTIDKILTNETYIGNIVFNRTSFKLQQKAIFNPPNMWVRRNNALEAIIAPTTFAKAQEIIKRRRQRLSDQETLDRLSALWRERGHLSHKIIIAAKNIPDTSTYINRFGSLTAAYRLIGFRPKPRYCWAETEARIRSIVDLTIADIISTIEKLGGNASFDEQARLLAVSSELTVSIGSARALSEGGGHVRWHVRINRYAKSDMALVIRMDPTNKTIQDYFMIPAAELAKTRVKKLRITSRVFAASCRHEDLDAFYRVCGRNG